MSLAPGWSHILLSYRRDNCLTQEGLAETLGVSAQTLSRWETGKQNPDPSHVRKIVQLIRLMNLSTQSTWESRVNTAIAAEMLLSNDSTVRAVSRAVLDFLNLDRESMIFRHVSSIIDPLDVDSSRSNLSNAVILKPSAWGTFDGDVSKIFQSFQFRRGSSCYRAAYEIWPLLTLEKDIVAFVQFAVITTTWIDMPDKCFIFNDAVIEPL